MRAGEDQRTRSFSDERHAGAAGGAETASWRGVTCVALRRHFVRRGGVSMMVGAEAGCGSAAVLRAQTAAHRSEGAERHQSDHGRDQENF